MSPKKFEPALSPTRKLLHEVIFEADTPAGKRFDVLLLWSIVFSTGAVMLESVEEIRTQHQTLLNVIEWTFTALFTLEYALRLWCVQRPLGYARSFFGIVDLASIIPTYLTLFIPGAQPLMVVRALRLLRIFRVFKLGHFISQGDSLMRALHASRIKITVFLFAVVNLTLILGTIMYLVEGPENGFSSIPMGMYWAIVTLTTVGYGDITPNTTLGQFVSACVMITGYAIIAIPTGIVSVEIAKAVRGEQNISTQACMTCSREGHDTDALHCKFGGAKM